MTFSLTRGYTKHNERVTGDGDRYANFLLLPSIVNFAGNYFIFFGNSADQCIKLAHIFCLFQVR